MIDLRQNITLQNQIKRAVNRLSKAVISDIDKEQKIYIVTRGFEIETSNHEKYQITLDIRRTK